jgi:hypothetical protein
MIMKLEDLVGMSTDKIIGSGRIILEESEQSQRTAISLKQLEKVVEIAKDLKWETIAIRIQNDYPLFVSDMREDKQEVIGVLIAPIINIE